MSKVDPTVTINLDGENLLVAEQSAGVQRLISVLDSWRQDEQDERDALIKTTAALRDLQRELYTTIASERAAANAPVPGADESELTPLVVDPTK